MKGERDGFGGPFSKLNLSDAQKEQISRLPRASTRVPRHAVGRSVVSVGAAISALQWYVRRVRRPRGGAGACQRACRDGSGHARMMSEMFNVLTAEQKAQLAAQQQQRQQKRQERRARRGMNPGQSM